MVVFSWCFYRKLGYNPSLLIPCMACWGFGFKIYDLKQWFSKWSISTHRGHIDHPRGWQIVTGSNWDQWITAGIYWNNEASNTKFLLIGKRMQMAFFNKSNKIKRADLISAKVAIVLNPSDSHSKYFCKASDSESICLVKKELSICLSQHRVNSIKFLRITLF